MFSNSEQLKLNDVSSENSSLIHFKIEFILALLFFPFLSYNFYTIQKKKKNYTLLKAGSDHLALEGDRISRMWFLHENWWRGVPVPLFLYFKIQKWLMGWNPKYKFEKTFDHVIQMKTKNKFLSTYVPNWEAKMNNYLELYLITLDKTNQ